MGLFHGDKTQHVVLHCNDRVVQIDFEVRESRTYSVFLDQELCEVSIDHTGGDRYDYTCRINHDAQTPLNELRKSHRDSQNRLEKTRIIAAGCVVLLIVFFLIGSALS
ncbi:hypothetical protein GGR28_002052 [Lewinella aquimaris]|uniref:Uncharacterized protein n=1 Tax=Neolewinella aquimaris TaxID=1835722 RepID=A0A840E6S6_9BACT|nr:hypothetical protein [Neolewinella aquimaris]MBB4079432.1 hypothetical protein [Neolewinella aquimaris]